MRIAVAGLELQVLEGAAARISRDRPILYVKCRDEGGFLQIAAWAEARDYTCWDTFNATPTQLFLPAETLSVERQIARLNAQAIRQGYRLRSQQCADHREENATQAEALRLRAALDDARSEIGRLRASLDSGGERIATLEREKSEIEAREAVERDKSRARQYAAERQASVARAEAARLRAEFTDLRGYARDLEKKHVDILASETWRAMEPVRWLLRGVLRRPAPATFVPRLAPAQPDANSASREWASEASLIGSDPRLSRGEKVVVFLTTYPGRAPNLPKVVDALLPQCDALVVYLNEYEIVPDCLDLAKIRAILGKDAAGDLKDNGKFFAVADYPDAYHVFADDDLVYPPDYVATIVQGIRWFGFKAIVGFHGTIYEPPLNSYIKDRTVLPFYAGSRATLVDQLGTGTAGCHASTFSADLSDFETQGMADLWFAKWAAETGVPMVALERPAKWLVGMEEIDDTLFRQVQRDESRERALLRERLAPALRQGRRMELLNFLQALYAPTHLGDRLDVAASAGGIFGGPASGARSDIHFALIVTGWNCEEFAEACLASIMGQIPGGYTLDIHVYEDGSDDDTWRIIEAKSDVLNLRAVRGERNMGPAFARDRLIRQVSNGDDICVLVDMDDELLPHALQDLEAAYRANPDCWMTYGNWVNQNGLVNDEGIYSDAEIDSRAYRALDGFRFTHLRSFRRFLYDRVEEAHLKDEKGEWLRYCSDVGLMLPIADQCASRNVVALDHPVYRYRQYQATGTLKRFGGDTKRETAKYLREKPVLARHAHAIPK